MAESTLTFDYDDYKARVGQFLGFTRTEANWTTEQAAVVEECVQEGYVQFLYPPPLPGETTAHQWSFLRQIATVTTTADDDDQDMDDNFGGISGMFLMHAAESGYPRVPIVPAADIRRLRQAGSSTGYPRKAAVEMKSSAGGAGQRWQMLWWPTPDSAYVLTFEKDVLMNKLSDSAPYALGGMVHSRTVLASMIAYAEANVLDQFGGSRWQQYMARLAASVSVDRAVGTPERLAVNGTTDFLGPHESDYLALYEGESGE